MSMTLCWHSSILKKRTVEIPKRQYRVCIAVLVFLALYSLRCRKISRVRGEGSIIYPVRHIKDAHGIQLERVLFQFCFCSTAIVTLFLPCCEIGIELLFTASNHELTDKLTPDIRTNITNIGLDPIPVSVLLISTRAGDKNRLPCAVVSPQIRMSKFVTVWNTSNRVNHNATGHLIASILLFLTHRSSRKQQGR